MSADKNAEAASGAEDVAPAPSKLPLILGLVNTVAVLAVMGVLVYTRVLYKRPAITEDGERARLAALHANPPPAPVPGMMSFDPITVNITPIPPKIKAADGTARQVQGKLHYAYVGFSLEVRDSGRKDELESLRPLILDSVIAILGKKSFMEITTVEGRYVLRTQMLEAANAIANSRPDVSPALAAGSSGGGAGGGGTPAGMAAAPMEPYFTNVYFTHFIVQ